MRARTSSPSANLAVAVSGALLTSVGMAGTGPGDAAAHWAFQPVCAQSPPPVHGTGWVRNPIDAFVLKRLEASQLSPAPPATRAVWLRRVHLDLTGLPPTTEQIDAFEADMGPEASDRVVDRLLASPAYGERWARHWLDLARYADSDGFEHDALRPNAWRYRDYAIAVFNADIPYDRFILEQLAGDERQPSEVAAVVATGFNLLGPDMVDSADQIQRRLNTLNDMTDTAASVFLGLTLGCARCHDHKSEPFTQQDYFSLQAYFAAADFQRERPISAAVDDATPRSLAADPPTSGAAAHKPSTLAMALATTNGPSPTTRVLFRGDYNQPREPVEPGIPAILRSHSRSPENPPPRDQGRRTALAQWIASPTNPLTARVLVNRVWQHHFGRGLVATPSDFGTRGEVPTHPELLDWLASDFMAHNWSIKHLHRLMVLSATYGQSSSVSSLAIRRDPDNRLYSRQNRIRLDGEVIRDCLLSASGRLNTLMGGPGVFPPIAEEIVRTSKNWSVSPRPADHLRRSVYIVVRRNLRFPFLEVFDAPDSNLSCPERGRSITAPQALSLLNAPEVVAAARATARRIAADHPTPPAQCRAAFRQILCRQPSEPELQAGIEFLETSPLHELCRALFNLNSFVYAD